MGHVFQLDFPPEYNNWAAVDPAVLTDKWFLSVECDIIHHIFPTKKIQNITFEKK
jgi:hypothetical protein